VGDLPAVNASPLIFLTHAGLLDLLQLAAPEIAVPAPVAEEIRRRGPGDPAAQALETAHWLQVMKAPLVPTEIQAWDLGPGESSVLAWCAARPEVEAIVDDLSARRCAEALGIPVRSTLGLVLIGKRRGRLHTARPVLDSLRLAGMYLSDQVMNRALRTVGSAPPPWASTARSRAANAMLRPRWNLRQWAARRAAMAKLILEVPPEIEDAVRLPPAELEAESSSIG
jgi:predicted nucleic acid-binding protein